MSKSKSLIKLFSYCLKQKNNLHLKRIKFCAYVEMKCTFFAYIRFHFEPATLLTLTRVIFRIRLLDDDTLFIWFECLVQTIDKVLCIVDLSSMTQNQCSFFLDNDCLQLPNTLCVRLIDQTLSIQIDEIVDTKAGIIPVVTAFEMLCRMIFG